MESELKVAHQGLKLVRYGTEQQMQQWLQENYPETYFFDAGDVNNLESLKIWIIAEVMSILEKEIENEKDQ